MKKPELKEIQHRSANVFILTAEGKIIGQLRDDKPNIDNPGKVGNFGGSIEKGESPKQAAWRELTQEETNLKIDHNDIHFLYEDVIWRKLTSEWEVRYFFYTRISDDELKNLEIYEGQKWVFIEGDNDPNLIEEWREPTKKVMEIIEQ